MTSVAIVRVGALGTVVANALARAGLGRLRLIDRDYVEPSNLQRQILYTEEDARLGVPKAEAAARHLGLANSSVSIEPVVVHVNGGNAVELQKDMDVIVDGSDNFTLRFVVNDACLRLKKPWIYGGALGDSGVTMNILPGEGPCLRCLLSSPPSPGSQPTCASAGVLNMITGIIGNIEAAEAMKIALGSPEVRKTFLSLSLWPPAFHEGRLERDPDCPACALGRYDFLLGRESATAIHLCGRDAMQVNPATAGPVDFDILSERLKDLGDLRVSPFMLVLSMKDGEIRVFRDGRAMITGVRDEAQARALCAEYLGL